MTRMLGTVLIGAAVFWGFVGVSCARGETIRHDTGGSVQARAEAIATQREPVRIVGYCASACTMHLGAPDVCVTRNARLGFHGPSTRSGLPLPRSEWERVSNVMADHYPPKLRLWFLTVGRENTGAVRVIRGAELIDMGVKECRG